MAPLTKWRCDVCGNWIESVDAGYVIWKSRARYSDFKVIHQTKCDRDDHHSSAALADFLGPRGATYMLSWLSPGPLIGDRDDGTGNSVARLSEFVDLFRRLQVPYYEEARVHFSDPEVRRDHSDWHEYAPYVPESLKAIAENYPRRRD